VHRTPRTTHRNREVLVRILEAIAVGDTGLAIALIDGELEDFGPTRLRAVCRGCGRGFEWPGLLERHQIDCAGLVLRIAA
jgi:hypothetical protein